MGFRNPLTVRFSDLDGTLDFEDITGFVAGSQLAAESIDGMTITGVDIIASTVTGGTIQTATAGERWAMTGGQFSQIQALTDDPAETSPAGLIVEHNPGSSTSVTLLSSRTDAGHYGAVTVETLLDEVRGAVYISGDLLYCDAALNTFLGRISAPTSLQRGSFTFPNIIDRGGADGTVTLPSPMAAAASVMLMPTSAALTCSVIAVTATTFTYALRNWSGAASGAGSVRWFALA